MTKAVELAQVASTGVSEAFKNRIINGAMVIDQRNSGASVTPANGEYTIDRWFASSSQASKFTIQQNAGSVTPPTGFTNYLGLTVGSSANVTVGATDFFAIAQYIEGFNVADLDWGSANARTVTLSFWVRSSLTGTFGGALRNSAANRIYPFSYSISSANTWEQKSITVAGDTSGTWLKTNGIGLALWLSIGTGSTYSDTAGAWTSKASVISATGATNLISTNNATFYITGVQLEVGSTATSFETRSYGTELLLCQRYYYRSTQYSTYSPVGVGRAWSTTTGNAPFFLPVPMRGNQTISFSSLSDFDIVTIGSPTSIGNDGAGPNNVKIGWGKTTGVTSGSLYQFEFGNTTSGWLAFSAEL